MGDLWEDEGGERGGAGRGGGGMFAEDGVVVRDARVEEGGWW